MEISQGWGLSPYHNQECKKTNKMILSWRTWFNASFLQSSGYLASLLQTFCFARGLHCIFETHSTVLWRVNVWSWFLFVSPENHQFPAKPLRESQSHLLTDSQTWTESSSNPGKGKAGEDAPAFLLIASVFKRWKRRTSHCTELYVLFLSQTPITHCGLFSKDFCLFATKSLLWHVVKMTSDSQYKVWNNAINSEIWKVAPGKDLKCCNFCLLL